MRPGALAIYGLLALTRSVGLAASRPDLVVSWQPVPAGLAGALAARRARCGHAVRTCGPELTPAWGRLPFASAALRPGTAAILREAGVVVAKSEAERVLARKLTHRPVVLIPNAVAASFFGPDRRLPGGQAVTKLITVCQLEPHKGLRQLLGALAGGELAGRCRLSVVGDGSQRVALTALARSSGVDAEFAGRIPHGELPDVYAAHDAFVLASSLESCSNAVLEAMAAGLPVIGPASAVADLVEDGTSGILAAGTGEQALRAAIARFLSAPGRMAAMGAAARHAARQHSPEKLIADYRELVRIMCGT